MSIVNSGQPLICPDPSDPVYGPSGFNVPVPSSTPGTPPQFTVNSGQAIKFYTIAATYLPQPSGGDNCYRFTFNGTIGPNGITTGTGYLGVVARLIHTDTTNEFLGGQTVYVNSANPVFFSAFWNFSSIFIPQPGDIIEIYVYNFTNANITNATLIPFTKGCGIELVSNQSAPALIFS